MSDITNRDDIIDSRDVIERIEELEAMRKPWIAGWNMPGYMPDNEPASFESFEDAKAYIIETLKRFEDEDAETSEDNATEYCHGAEEINLTSGTFSRQFCAYVFWASEVDGRDAFEDESDFDEYTALKALADEAEGYADDWEYGSTLIRDSHFVDAMQELCADIGDVPKDMPSYLVIDWDATAENLKADYTSVEFDGVTYWVR